MALNQKDQKIDPETGLILSDELYTPELIVYVARLVMSGIDIDPCTSESANARSIQAEFIGTKDKPLDYGALPSTATRLWCNPPYSRLSGGALPHVEKILSWLGKEPQVNRAMILLRQDSSTKVSKLLSETPYVAKCDLYQRPQFWGPGDRGIKGQHAYTLWCIADGKLRFFKYCAEFKLGKVWQ